MLERPLYRSLFGDSARLRMKFDVTNDMCLYASQHSVCAQTDIEPRCMRAAIQMFNTYGGTTTMRETAASRAQSRDVRHVPARPQNAAA